MHKQLVLMLISLSVAACAYARLGETEAQIEKRYGKPLNTSDMPGVGTVSLYRAFNMEMAVAFSEHKAVSESFAKSNKQQFNAAEIEALLAANTPPKTSWKYDGVQWMRSDQVAGANIANQNGEFVFSIVSAAFAFGATPDQDAATKSAAKKAPADLKLPGIGMTKSTVETRWGKPVREERLPDMYGMLTASYQMSRLDVLLHYQDDKVSVVELVKPKTSEFSDAEISAFLKANTAPSTTWFKQNGMWFRSDMQAFVVPATENLSRLMAMSKAFYEQKEADVEQKRKKALKGL